MIWRVQLPMNIKLVFLFNRVSNNFWSEQIVTTKLVNPMIAKQAQYEDIAIWMRKKIT